MSKKHLTIASWFLVPAISFALGWLLKPTPHPSESDPSQNKLQAVKRSPISALEIPTKQIGAGSGDYSDASSPSPLSDERSLFGSGNPWTTTEIQEIGAAFKRELDPVKRRLAFVKLLEGMTVENAKQIREQIAGLPADSPEFRDFHYAWGKIAGIEAIMHGAETSKPDMVATLAGWASAEPEAAREWFAGLDPQSKESYANQEYLKMGMVHGLSNIDSSLATSFVLERAAAGDRQVHHMLGIVTHKILQTQGTVEAANWAQNLPPGEMRGAALGRVAHSYAQSDPKAAANWVRSIANDANGSHAVGAVSRQMAQRDGAAAIAWVDSLGDSPHRSSAYYSTFEGWAGKDPAAASQHLVEMPASPDRDSAIGGLVSRHRWEDPVSAITWSAEIADAGTRERSMISAGQAYLRRDPAAAREWLPSSGLSAEAQKKITAGR